jgi:L-amino acid N-acyltransferase YncA
MNMLIRPAGTADVQRICDIYNHYVLNTIITFEEAPVSHDEMSGRISAVTQSLPWIISETDGDVAGYAYASTWRTRSAYRFSVESTIYVDRRFLGRGIGRQLYATLLSELRARGMHCVLGGIALPNAASVALHEALGFRKVAHLPEVGWKLQQWIDVGYWELVLSQDQPGKAAG